MTGNTDLTVPNDISNMALSKSKAMSTAIAHPPAKSSRWRLPNPLAPTLRAWRYGFSSGLADGMESVERMKPNVHEIEQLSTLSILSSPTGGSFGLMAVMSCLPFTLMLPPYIYFCASAGLVTLGVGGGILLLFSAFISYVSVWATRDEAKRSAWPARFCDAVTALRIRGVDIPDNIQAVVHQCTACATMWEADNKFDKFDIQLYRTLGARDTLGMIRLTDALKAGSSTARVLTMDGETSEMLARVSEVSLPQSLVSQEGLLRLSVMDAQ